MRGFVDYPNPDSPNLPTRLIYISTAIDLNAKLIQLSGKPALIDRFTLNFNGSSNNERSIPVDDFHGIFSAFSLSYEEEIGTFNYTDANLLGVARKCRGSRLRYLGYRGYGTDGVLMGYPRGATDRLEIWYYVSPNLNPSLNDTPQIPKDFVNLVAVQAGMMYLDSCHWDDIEPFSQAEELYKNSKRLTLTALSTKYELLLKEFSENPNVIGPKNELRGAASERRRWRRGYMS